jgi:methyl-accepting chemotaxis protein
MLPKDTPQASNEVILRAILDALTSLHDGHFTTHLTEQFPGIGGEIAKVFNAHLEMLRDLRQEHRRLMEEIGVTGRLGGQMEVSGLGGAWKEMVEDVNRMSAHITIQCRDHGNVVRALVQGDLGARVTSTAIRGELRELREGLNELADRYEQRSSPATGPATT